jgi:hypothetical protein
VLLLIAALVFSSVCCLLAASGHEVLSGDVPVGVEDIEQLVGSGLR